jgi:hypothetical protein
MTALFEGFFLSKDCCSVVVAVVTSTVYVLVFAIMNTEDYGDEPNEHCRRGDSSGWYHRGDNVLDRF